MAMKKWSVSRTLVFCLLVAHVLVCLYPLIWLLFYSLKDNQEIFITNPFGPPMNPQWENYAKAFELFNMGLLFKNTLIITVVTVTLEVVFSCMFTYVISRVRTRFTRFLQDFITAALFIPIQAIMIPLVVNMSKLHLSGTIWPLILAYVATCFPFAIMIMYGFFRSIPMEFEEAAYIDGSGFNRTFWSIIFPQLKPIISVLIIYQFMSHWNEYGLALVLLTDVNDMTLSVGLNRLYGQYATDWGPIGASMVVCIIPVLIIFLLFSRQITNAMVYSGIKN